MLLYYVLSETQFKEKLLAYLIIIYSTYLFYLFIYLILSILSIFSILSILMLISISIIVCVLQLYLYHLSYYWHINVYYFCFECNA